MFSCRESEMARNPMSLMYDLGLTGRFMEEKTGLLLRDSRTVEAYMHDNAGEAGDP